MVCAIFFVSAQTAGAQQTEQPLWLQMDRGVALFDEGRLGDALKIFRDVVQRDSSFGNAHMWIGHILAAEGEYEAAVKKYEDALRPGCSFFPGSERVEAYYSLAEISLILGDLDGSRTYLDKVLDLGREEQLPPSRRSAMIRKFIEEGPDKTLELYRLKDKAVRRAYQMYGELELREGRYEEALEHLLLSIMTSLSLVIDNRMHNDPEYVFIQDDLNPGVRRFYTENTARLVVESRRYGDIDEYFTSVGLFRQLFLLGMALLGIDEPEKAQDIWLIVTDNREAGIWFEFAQRQISGPDMKLLSAALQYR